MLDLVNRETQRIESRFLEPACGTGNFLTEILGRKLRVVESRYGRSQLEFERYAVIAVASLYGIDILEDNVVECRRRLSHVVDRSYSFLFRDTHLAAAVDYILQRNIIWGDALTLKTVGTTPRPIVFSEWSLVKGSMIKRRDFAFQELLHCEGIREEPLFSDLGEKVFIPKPIREYPPTHFKGIADVG